MADISRINKKNIDNNRIIIYGDSINKQNIEHLPIGAHMNNMKLIEWWQDRTIN